MGLEKTLNTDLNRLSNSDFKSSVKTGIYIILENLRSGLNIGSVFRTADAFRIEKILITGASAVPPNKEILKTALGATETVSWEKVDDCMNLVKKLQNKGIKVYAVEQTQNSCMLHHFEPNLDNGIAFIFGNEVEGVTQEVVNACDGVLEIPQFGTKHSLNVAVSSGIVLWHVMQKVLAENRI
jgi:23S rRNA (guanosine2251-2'-O)-methyltransferase